MKVKIYLFALVAVAASSAGFVSPNTSKAAVETSRPITFPVIGDVWYGNSFQDPRDGGVRWHKGVDIFGDKMTPLVAAVDGEIIRAPYPEASWGYGVAIRDKDGYEYWYIHLNNDAPGTDNGKADGSHIYALDIMRGNTVKAGQLIGYMGDSGNAETTPPHLHFEMYAPGENLMNPYETLNNAARIKQPLDDYPELTNEILPFGNFSAGGSVAVGVMNPVPFPAPLVDSGTGRRGNSTEEFIITGAGPGGEPLVRVFSPSKSPLASFYAYDKIFRGGVDVATGDTDGDGTDEIITSAGPGGGPHIRVFNLEGKLLHEFFAFSARFKGGVNVSAVDTDGDGRAEIVTAPKAGGGPHVKIFKNTGQLVSEFFAYDEKFHGGVDVAGVSVPSSSVGNDAGVAVLSPSGGRDREGVVITAPGQGGGPHVKVFNATGNIISEFLAFDSKFNLGLRVSAATNTSSENSGVSIAVIPASDGGPHRKIFGLNGEPLKEGLVAFEPWWRGGYDIAASNGGSAYIISGSGRRVSLRSDSSRRVDTPQPDHEQLANLGANPTTH